MTLKTIIEEYLKSKKYSIKRRTYLYYLQINREYISKYTNKLTKEEINKFLFILNQSLSYSTIRAIKSLINRSLDFAFNSKMINESICVDIQVKKKIPKKIEALEKREQRKLEEYILNRHKPYSYGILISLYTGLRLGELLSLKWKNVDLIHKIICVDSSVGTICTNHKAITFEDLPKTQSSIREIPISIQLMKILRELKKERRSEYVLSSHSGKQIYLRAYQKSFENLLKRLNIKHYGFHSLRHTFATRLLENNIDIKTISELLGHSSPSITLNRYVHTSLEKKRNAIEFANQKREC